VIFKAIKWWAIPKGARKALQPRKPKTAADWDEPQRIMRAIRALPAAGDGMTVGDIANAVGTDAGMVVSALESIVERDEAEEQMR
jgi:hypothetical protein